jgi:hypothetical protein
MGRSKEIPGINVQWPWSELLISGQKTVETRSYQLPKRYLGKELALIETPGPRGKTLAGIKSARIIGIITFSNCFQYPSRKAWQLDRSRHQVGDSDEMYNYNPDKQKWGWTVEKITKVFPPKPAPQKRGIIFALRCKI